MSQSGSSITNSPLSSRLNRINSGSFSQNNASSISSSIRTSSPRNSITSSNASKYASGLTATSTFSSIDEHYQTSTSNSSAIGFLNDSIVDGDDFGYIDGLEYEDIDDGLIGNHSPSVLYVCMRYFNLKSVSHRPRVYA